MNSIPNSGWPEIIGAAAVSPLGILALIVLVVGLIATLLFSTKDKPSVRVTVLALIVVAFSALGGFALYQVQPSRLSSKPKDTPSSTAPDGNATTPKPPLSTTQPAQTVAPLPSVRPQPAARVDCGQHWSGWIEVGGAVGNPCPEGCSRGDELGQSYRVVGFPPRPQTQHKFQCWRN